MLDPRQLRALVAVATEGSVSRAATILAWSQPTVDYHIKALEALIGTPLISRSNTGSTLTPAGHLLAERAHELLAQAERTVTDVREFAEVGHTKVKFGSFPTAAGRLLPGMSRKLQDVGIELDTVLAEVGPLVSSINTHAVDAALVYSASGYQLPFRKGVQTLSLFTDPLLLALPHDHPAAAQRVFTADDLYKLGETPWVIGATPGDSVDDVLKDIFTESDAQMHVALRTDDYSVALGMVAAGMGIGLVPRLATRHVPQGVTLKDIDDNRFAREILLAVSGAVTPSIRQLAEAIRKTAAEQGELQLS